MRCWDCVLSDSLAPVLYVVYNRHTEFQADIFVPASLITKRIKKVLFSKFTKSSFRSLNPKSVSVQSVTHCSLTFEDADTSAD